MDKLKNILNKCDSLENKHKESLEKLQSLIKNNQIDLSSNTTETKELKNLLLKAKNVIMTPEQLNKLKKEQKQIMNDFENIYNSYDIKKSSNSHFHTEVKPVQIVNVYKNGALITNPSQQPQFISFNNNSKQHIKPNPNPPNPFIPNPNPNPNPPNPNKPKPNKNKPNKNKPDPNPNPPNPNKPKPNKNKLKPKTKKNKPKPKYKIKPKPKTKKNKPKPIIRKKSNPRPNKYYPNPRPNKYYPNPKPNKYDPKPRPNKY